MSYETLKVQKLQNGQIAKVSINRPKIMNAMNPKFFEQIESVFLDLNKWEDLRVAILVGQGKVFTAGLDLKQAAQLFIFQKDADMARQSISLYEKIRILQRQFLSIIECKVPVISGVHNTCVGGGIDLNCMTDIRYCTKDAKYTIKQVDIGIAADLGTLQLFPNLTGNQSTFRELAYTGRWMYSQEAKQIGFVSKIFEDKQKMNLGLLQTAQVIASKSPVAIHTLKHVMRRQQYKKVQESLAYMARVNSSAIFTNDTMQSISAFMQKRKPQYAKL